MHTKKRAFLSVILPLIGVLALVLAVACYQPAYAKGPQKSHPSSDQSKSESKQENSSKNENSSKHESSSSQQSSSKSDSSGSSSHSEKPAPPPPNYSRSEERRSDNERRSEERRVEERRADTERRSEERQVEERRADAERRSAPEVRSDTERRPASSTDRLKGRSVPDLGSRLERRSDNEPARREVRVSDQRGLHRKDYEDIGRIWRSRHERRDTVSDRLQRSDITYRRHYWDIDRFHSYPWSFRYYVYDYRPLYSYPSLYCFYYDFFPPYIYGHRAYYIPLVVRHYRYVDVPLIILSYNSYNWDGDYYLWDSSQRSLSDALRDIRRAWERNDIDLLMDHVRRGSRIAVYIRDEYAYSVDSQDYYDMTRDAMSVIRTRSFELDRIRRRDNAEVVAYGRHSYSDQEDSSKTVYVSYTLERRGSEWYITEVGSSSSRWY